MEIGRVLSNAHLVWLATLLVKSKALTTTQMSKNCDNTGIGYFIMGRRVAGPETKKCQERKKAPSCAS